MKKKNIIEYLHELEAKNEPQIIQTEDPFAADVRAMVEARREQPEEVVQVKKKRRKANVNICPNCSKIMMGDRKRCPSCSFVMF